MAMVFPFNCPKEQPACEKMAIVFPFKMGTLHRAKRVGDPVKKLAIVFPFKMGTLKRAKRVGDPQKALLKC